MPDQDFDRADRLYARSLFSSGQYRLVIVQHGRLLYWADQPRLLPLAAGLVQLGAEAEDAVVMDKVIGRAAAMLLAAFAVSAALTPVISRGAQSLLETAGVVAEADRAVDGIRSDSGQPCPMEVMVEPFDDPVRGAQCLLDFFAAQDLLKPFVLHR